VPVPLSAALVHVVDVSMMWIILMSMIAGILAGYVRSLIPTGENGDRRAQ
jgi:hypothetical protein